MSVTLKRFKNIRRFILLSFQFTYIQFEAAAPLLYREMVENEISTQGNFQQREKNTTTH